MATINSIIWCCVTILILLLGFYFTFKLKGIQFRFFSMFKSVFSNSGNVSSFALLMTSLAGRIGVGSIAGVCLSIYIGGVGSIFWMWISTFFCAVITYCECVLGVKYKVIKGNSYNGGPSYYIRDGVGSNWLGFFYSILIIISYVGCFLSIQSNTITKSLIGIFPFSPYVIGICISVVTFFCIYGGFKRIVNVSEKIVPFMGLVYISASLVVIVKNFSMVGSIFFDILKSAFAFKPFVSGFIPMVIIGIERGIFSNEAGIGTSSMVTASSDSSDYVRQGMTQMLGIYITTLLICSATAIILLTSNYKFLSVDDINGIELAMYAFKYHFGNVGIYILVVSIILFSFSTIITGYYYGETSFNYFFDKLNIKLVYVLRGITLIVLFLGCILPSNFLWGIVDVLVGLLVLINLYAIWILSDKVD